MNYPSCYLCRQPVACGQHDGAGRPAHYGCLGMCRRCFQRPAVGAGYPHPDWCERCPQSDEDDTAKTEPDSANLVRFAP